MNRISAADLATLLTTRAEHAVLDAREEGVFSESHLFWAVPLPLSHLEARLGDLVPGRATPIVWVDDGWVGLAEDAAERTRALGYTDVSVLDGGLDAWEKAGYEIYAGVNVPSKAFGEFVEHAYDTPRVSADELAALTADGADLVILDSRPTAEFNSVSIPGGTCCAGAELVYRAADMAPNPDTLVVVNCAGRTRSIIGAQSLRNAGLPNKVVALKDGTMGWELSGRKSVSGAVAHAPDPSAENVAAMSNAVKDVADRFDVRAVDWSRVAAWQADTAHTTVLFDVRTSAEYEAGHIPGSRWAEGGQLVQATDAYIATRNARLVLIDEGSGVRATMTASWLRQMGWFGATVVEGGLQSWEGGELETGAREVEILGQPTLGPDDLVTADALAAELGSDSAPVVLDLADHRRYGYGHVPGAYWIVRSRLAAAYEAVGNAGSIVVTSPDSSLATTALEDIRGNFPSAQVRVLEGGTRGWKNDGHTIEEGPTRLTTETDDVWRRPYDGANIAEVQEAMKAYLNWEVDLVGQLDRDPLVNFQKY